MPRKDKYRQSLNRLIDNGKFIPGIYNYCDRWCERCTMSHKCLTYANEKEMFDACSRSDHDDFDPDKLCEQLLLSFEVAIEMISEKAKKMNIGPGDALFDTDAEMAVDPVVEMTTTYGSAMGNWLVLNDHILDSRINQLKNLFPAGDRGSALTEAVDVLRWYCYFIEAKVSRAFFGMKQRMEDQSDEFDALADNNGSAKAAILAIDRSIEALILLYCELTDHEDEILEFLSSLSEIKKYILLTFPEAMNFKRPGFDDE